MSPVLQKLGALAVPLLTSLCASAYDFDTGGIYYNITNATAKEVEVTSGDNRYTDDVAVPSSVTYNNRQYTVAAIGEGAFSWCTGLTTITLPTTVKTIGKQAFSTCWSLTSITSLAVTPPACAELAFDGVYNQKCPLFVPANSVEAYTQATGWNEFAFIAEVGTVKSFEVDGIYYNVTDPKTKTVEVIKGENKYSGDIIVPSTVTYNNKEYPVMAIGEKAFDSCTGLTSITLPNTVTTIGTSAFSSCYALTTITLPNSLTVIKSGTFAGCRGLTSVTLPNSLITIESEAFNWCPGLTTITLPGSVTTIKANAFNSCSGLTTITSQAVTPPKCDNGYTFNGVDKQKCSLFVPAESVDAYKQAPVWQDFAYIDEIGAVRSFEVDGIRYNVTDKTAKTVEVTFGENKYTGEIAVPSTVTYNDKEYTVTAIGYRAFAGSSGLTSVTLPNTVTTIGDCAFDNCYELTSVILPNTVTTIGDYAFSGCSGLTSITSLAVTPPGCSESAFTNVNRHSCVLYVPAESIEAYKQAEGWKIFAFIEEVGGVNSFVVNGIYYNVTDKTAMEVEVTYGENKYSSYVAVPSTVTFHNKQYTVTAIGNNAFANCEELTSVSLPGTVTAVGDNAFSACSALTSIAVDADNQAYSSVDGILYDKEQTSLICCPAGRTGDATVPNTVTTVCDTAFAGCSGLTSITSLAVNPPVCGESAFEGVDKENCLLYVPAESIEAYKQADGWKEFLLIEEIGGANSFEVDGFYYNVTAKTAKTVEVTSGENKYTGEIAVPSTVTYHKKQYTVTAVGNGAFANCEELTSVAIPSSVTAIAEGTFINCKVLMSIDVDAENQAYSSVDGILYDKAQTSLVCYPAGKTGEVTVPNTVTTVCDKAFAGCSGLTSITSLAVNPPVCGESAFEGVDKENCLLYVPAESIGAYKQAEGWKEFLLIEEIGGANSFEVDGFYYNVTDKTAMEVEVTYGENKYSGDIAVPSTVTYHKKQYTVTAVGNGAFANCEELTSVAIPSSVTAIEGDAFINCSALTSIAVDADNQAYSSVDGILYDKAQTSLICCPAGKTGDVTVPNTVTTVCDKAFAGCSGLTSITSLAVNPPVCGESAFEGVDKENCYLYVPAESIESYKQAEGWKEFLLIEEIGGANSFEVEGFYYNVTDKTAMEVEVTYGENKYSGDIAVPFTVTYHKKQYTVTAVGNGAFANCEELTSVAIPSSVTTIAEGAFINCSALTSIAVDAENQKYSSADGILYDKEQTSLICCPAGKTGEVTVPNTVTTVCDKAFAGCSGLTSITSLAVNPPVCGESAFEGVDKQNCLLYVPAGSADAYKQAEGWKDFLNIEEIKDEDPDSFEVDGLYYNVIDKTAKEVEVAKGEKEYSGEITVPSSVSYNDKQYTVTAVSDRAFYECGDLKSVILPGTVTEIRDYTFYGCDSLATVSLPVAVTTIGKQVFAGCYKLASIAIPGSVTAIGDGAFANCSALTSIEVDEDNQAYSSVDGILYDKAQTSLICCPGGVQGDVLIPGTVTTICDNSFAGCSGLTTVILPDAVTTIGSYAFSYCYSLSTITLPASVTTIGRNAFADCRSLASVTSLATVPPVCGTYTFDGVGVESCTLYVPKESVDAYKEAPVWKEFGLIEEYGAVSGIGSIDAGSMTDEEVEVFSVNGAKVSDTLRNLPAGMYIVRSGSTVRKVVIR